jgi:hypothetical protein
MTAKPKGLDSKFMYNIVLCVIIMTSIVCHERKNDDDD